MRTIVLENIWTTKYVIVKGMTQFDKFLSITKNDEQFYIFADERPGNLVVVAHEKTRIENIASHLYHFLRPLYITPPCFGCYVVANCLRNRDLYNEW